MKIIYFILQICQSSSFGRTTAANQGLPVPTSKVSFAFIDFFSEAKVSS